MSVIRRNGLQAAIVVLAGFFVYVGIHEVSAGRIFGILGGLLIMGALLARRRSRLLGAGLLLIGALPLAVTTWWSIITPLIAVLVLLLGLIVLARKSPFSTLAAI